MTGIHVNVDNFARAETERMFAGILQLSGGVNSWRHDRQFAPLDQQPVIRQNRDTFYSVAIVDITRGGTLTLPDAGARYLSVMIINQDHYINDVLHESGDHALTMERYGTPYVCVGVRILVDPNNPDDLATVHRLQDRIGVRTGSSQPFVLPDYEPDSFTATRQALLELAKGIGRFDRAFGARAEVDPVRHLVGTAAGWGGLPQEEAFYVNVNPALPVGAYDLTVGAVPVDAFWSISVYNEGGFFEANAANRNNVNSISGARNDDGTITVRFGADPAAPNCLPITDGWNYLVRLYRPHPEILDGSWTFPSLSAG